MLIGQTVFVPAAGSPGVTYYGPWMPRQGDACTAVAEVINASAASGWTFKLTIETKNNEDPDTGATPLGNNATSAVGTFTVPVTACLELIRYVISGTGGGTDRWIHYRCNPPIWNPN